ncbi:MAG: putative ABC transporter permease, partial [Dysosmobacter sp.]|nr:putative ABC transporter permease [Dysosmobacter sp.]
KISGHIIRGMLGGILYGSLEGLYRGYTHWSMMLLAALLCVPLDIANERMPWTLPLCLQAALGGLAITAAELAAGLVLNVWLGLAIWDYSALPWNLWGQICLRFSVLWCLLAGPVIVAFDWLDYWLCDGDRPRYRLL